MEVSDCCNCHKVEKDTGRRRAVIKLLVAATLGILFMTGEFLGGYFANSLAIMSDAAHMLTDVAGFGISLFAIWLGSKKPSALLTFGWQRAEVLGALVSVSVIWGITVTLFYESIKRLSYPDSFEVNPEIMLITACIGVFVNIFMCLVLHQGQSHNHAHIFNHAHQFPEEIETGEGIKKEGKGRHMSSKSINVKAAMIHAIGDLLQSIGVVIAGFIIWFKSDWKIIDPICTLIFSVLMFLTTITVLKDVLRILLEAVPAGVNFKKVRDDLNAIEGVKHVHSLYIWSITTGKTALAAHLAIESDVRSDDVIEMASDMLKKVHLIKITTLQVEAFDPKMENCHKCVEETHREGTSLVSKLFRVRRRPTVKANYQLVPQESTE